MTEIYQRMLKRVWLRDEAGKVTRWGNFRLNFEPVYAEEEKKTVVRFLDHLNLLGFPWTPYTEGQHWLTLLGELDGVERAWLSIPHIVTDGWDWKARSNSPTGEILRVQLGDPSEDIPLVEYWNEEI